MESNANLKVRKMWVQIPALPFSLCDFKQIEYTPMGSVSLSVTRDVNDYLICLLVCLF